MKHLVSQRRPLLRILPCQSVQVVYPDARKLQEQHIKTLNEVQLLKLY